MAIVTMACLHGTLSFLDNDKWIGKALKQTGTYSEPEVQKLLSLINVESVVVEVGAHWGSISVPLAKKAKLFAFEPQRQIFDLLEKNLVQNCHGFCCENLIVGRKPGMATMRSVSYDAEDVNSGATEVNYDEFGDIHDTPVVTLDDYCEDFARLDLIKIDAEGSELDVIAGAIKTITRFHPLLYVENDRREKSHDLIEQIMALGYRLYWHLPALYNPDPVAVQCTVSINMLCAPPLRLVDVSDLTLINSADDDWRLAYERRKQAPAPVPIKKKQWAVVARLGGVGDNLMASAVLPYLKEKYGFVEVISATPQHVVFENNPYVDKLSIKQPGQPKWEDGKKWQEYWLDRASEVAFFAQLSHSCEGLRAYNESQTAFYWSDTARRKFAGHSYLETVADICEVPYDQLKPDFFPTETEVAQARNVKELVGGRYVAWVISGTRPDKIWPPAAAAIYRIIRELDTAVVLFGMPGKDFEIAKEIEKSVNIAAGSTRGLHLALSTSTDAPNWPLRRVLTQVQLADVVVSPDTGPAWAVAMHAIPKIIMVSHASPENITKHWRNTLTLHADPGRVACWPCHCLHDTKESCERLSGRKDEVGAACISDITVDKVIDAVAACLRTGGFNTAALAAE